MIVIFKHNVTDTEINNVSKQLEDYGFEVHTSVGVNKTVMCGIGDKPDFDIRKIKIMNGVSDVIKVSDPFRLVGRSYQDENSVIKIKDISIGTEQINIIAGPCAVESEEQIFKMAKIISDAGVKILRGGAFKPRSSPYSFQGMGEDGLKVMRKAADEFGLLVITEILQVDQIDLVHKYTDIFQVGTRNMQNYPLLRELGKSDKPVFLKRGLSATINEWLMSAEYILANGNKDVMLCERGIRTFENATRNTFDLSAIPVIHEKSHLPVFADPSHAVGMRDQVPPMARAAVAAGADGLMLEVHYDPEKALSDGPQALLPETFVSLMDELKVIAKVIGRKI